MNFRTLKENEIEVRVGTINEKGATLLLYKDSRTDQSILDETVTPFGWQRKHYELKGNIYCSVGIKDDKGEWIWKDDAGAESQHEAVKGEASDSFKRACFNWGLGRELYTAPFTWIAVDKYNGYKNPKTGKYATYDKFSVEKIKYNDNREIVGLSIVNDKTKKRVFTYTEGKATNGTSKDEASATPEQKQSIAVLLGLRGIQTKDMPDTLEKQYNVPVGAVMTFKQAEEILKDLQETK